MPINFYPRSSLTGGVAGSLDNLDGADLGNGDFALVQSDVLDAHLYVCDINGGAGESSPDIIVPDTNPGSINWLLLKIKVGGGVVLPTDIGVLATAKEWTAQQNFNEAAITSTSNATAWNLDTAQCALHTLTENTTISAPSNMNAGSVYVLRVVQAAGVYTLAWNAVFDWGEADTPAAPAANGDVCIFTFYSDGTNMYGVESNRSEA
jgi:hypothetical protein